MRFTKMHGLGNDYIVVEWTEIAKEISSVKIHTSRISEQFECKFSSKHPETEQILRAWIRHVCDRHFGIGADGVLIICPSQTADFRMLIYNADGSRAKMCGNGIRCCAKYMWDKQRLENNSVLIKRHIKNPSNNKVEYNTGIHCKNNENPCKSGSNEHNRIKNEHKSGIFKTKTTKIKHKSGDNERKNGYFKHKCGDYRPQTMKIDTDSGIKTVEIIPNKSTTEILVNMGRPSTDYEHLHIDYQGKSYTVIPVSMGNLHAVVFLDKQEKLWDDEDVYTDTKEMLWNDEDTNTNTQKYADLAAYIQNLDYFADSVNVEFAQIIDDSHIRMRVWERGVGETLACGTGACAVCVAVKINAENAQKSASDTNMRLNAMNDIRIKLKGGTLKISWMPGKDVWMSGPAVTVFEGIN